MGNTIDLPHFSLNFEKHTSNLKLPKLGFFFTQIPTFLIVEKGMVASADNVYNNMTTR